MIGFSFTPSRSLISSTGVVIQHELLLRLRDRAGALVAPLDFLPTAERCGLIDEIDRWVVTQAIAVAAGGRKVAVNVSGQSAADPAFLELIERELGPQWRRSGQARVRDH